MNTDNHKSDSQRIGEQKLIKDDLLLDWFPKETKEIPSIDTATQSFIQRGTNKSESYSN